LLDFIPQENELMERKMSDLGLTGPDIAVLLCQSKIHLKEAILASDLPEDGYLRQFLVTSFPKPLQARFSDEMQAHPLRREIISTKLSNMVVNEVGFSFVYRLQDETGASVPAIVRAYIIARTVLNMESLWQKMEALHASIKASDETDLLMDCIRILRRTTRWFVRQTRMHIDISETIQRYTPGLVELKRLIPTVFGADNRKQYDELMSTYQDIGLPHDLAHEMTSLRALFSAPDILEVASEEGVGVAEVAKIYFGVGEFLHLNWIRYHVIVHVTENHWEALSREALRDDLDWQQRQLTAGVIRQLEKKKIDIECYVKSWSKSHTQLIERWNHILTNLRSSSQLNYTMFFVAIRELSDLTQTTLQYAETEVEA
jgi:glutamate dehydrogenase